MLFKKKKLANRPKYRPHIQHTNPKLRVYSQHCMILCHLKHRFYIIICYQASVCLPHRGRPWRCPRGPCCWPHSPEPGCSTPPTCPTHTGCRFRSGSTPVQQQPRGFHPYWWHAGPGREVSVTTVWDYNDKYVIITWNTSSFKIKILFLL